jgi:hypothetical protein
MSLKDGPNFEDADGFYAALLAAHKGLSAAQSQALNARLVLILANQVGEKLALEQALELAGNQGQEMTANA